jgi:hypothetical protein
LNLAAAVEVRRLSGHPQRSIVCRSLNGHTNRQQRRCSRDRRRDLGFAWRFNSSNAGVRSVRFISRPGAGIVDGRIDFVVFFWDPLESHPHDVDVKALLRVAVVHNIPIACNCPTADFFLSSPLVAAERQGRHLASRDVIVRPENRRAARTLSLRGGSTDLRHRSDQQAAAGVVEASGWLTSKPPRKTRSATFFV